MHDMFDEPAVQILNKLLDVKGHTEDEARRGRRTKTDEEHQ
jgi:hypothetical protein